MISIIIPVYNEQDSIHELYKKIVDEIYELNYEIIFIDDGSTDDTVKKINSIENSRVILDSFKINKGKSEALMKGIEIASGDYIITMDGDLQDDPVEILKFITEIKKNEYDVISGWKQFRNDPLTKIIPSKFFNWLSQKVTKVKLNDMNCGYKIYTKEAAMDINIYGELHRYIPALLQWKGYRIGEMVVHHHERKFGYSKYGIERLLKGFLDLITIKYITSYINRPLHLFGTIGIIFGGIGIALGLYLTMLRIFTGTIQSKLPLLILTAILIMVCVQLILFGLIGEMIVDIKQEIKKK